MPSVEHVLSVAVERFLAAEFPDGPPPAPPAPTIAAIGTIAETALANPLLRGPLASAGIAPAAYRAFSDPAALLADRSWALALVISPYKLAITPDCDALAPAAAATSVVDTVLRAPTGAIGVNTNTYAAAEAICHLLGGAPPGRVLIAGTGASARSVAHGVRRLAPDATLGVIGRSAERAATVVRDLGAGPVVEDAAAFAADLVVHATTVGERDDVATLSFDLGHAFAPGVRFLDLTNRQTPLQRAAVEAGCVAMSGILMQLLTNALRVALLAPRPPTGSARRPHD
jgi:shikimate dehydrogenase